MIVVLDNYDSFVFNLARYFERLCHQTIVVRNDQINAAAIRAMRPDALILSPGPCTPRQAGASIQIVRELNQELPILGICLGHQTIAEALGAQVIPAAEPVHGRASPIHHTGQGVFAGLPTPLNGCRYHSLIVDESSLPDDLRVTARTSDGLIMAFAHGKLPVVGLQFHPESILTDHGYELLANFLTLSGLRIPPTLPTIADEPFVGACGPASHWLE